MILQNPYNQIRDLPDVVVAIIFFTPIVGGLIWYLYKTRHARSWRKGILPPKLKFNQDNLLEVYLSVGARMILLDYQHYKGKTQYINQYFNRYFRESNYNFADSLVFSMQHPIKVESACTWLNEHLKEEGERAQVIYFLAGLALLDGTIRKQELAFLTLMNRELGLDDANLRRIIAIYESYHQSRQEEAKKTSRRRPSIDRLAGYRTILGISTSANQEEIKKAYRKLVKQHHPDAFANASEAQRRMAEAKFIQIQEAYEALSGK